MYRIQKGDIIFEGYKIIEISNMQNHHLVTLKNKNNVVEIKIKNIDRPLEEVHKEITHKIILDDPLCLKNLQDINLKKFQFH